MAIKKNVREEVLEMAKKEVLVPEKVVSVDTVPDPIYNFISGGMSGRGDALLDINEDTHFPVRGRVNLNEEEKEALAFALHWLDFFSKGSRNVEFRKGVKNFKNLFSKFQ